MPPTPQAHLYRLATRHNVSRLSSTIITHLRPTPHLPPMPSLQHPRPASSTSNTISHSPSGGTPLARPDPDTNHASTLINPTPQVDQTRTDPTDPSSSKKTQQIGGETPSGGEAAKAPDPQEPGSRSTGIEKEGPQGRSGDQREGEVTTQRGSGPFMRQE